MVNTEHAPANAATISGVHPDSLWHFIRLLNEPTFIASVLSNRWSLGTMHRLVYGSPN